MLRDHRARFNAAFTPERYRAFVHAVEARAGVPVEFRLSETPCFFAATLMDTLVDAACDIVSSLLDDPAYRRAAAGAVPAEFRVANGEVLPTFVQVDFGLLETHGHVEGRLVELQAFPSLYGFQLALAEIAQEVYRLDGLSVLLGGLDHAGYLHTMRRAIVGDHDPSEVVLMEIEPARQKTRPDFAVTEQLWGVRSVDTADVVREGRRLFARGPGGTLTRITRIYNRVIPDELSRKGIALPFDYRDDLDVEWAGGPDWFFKLSKFSIPWIKHRWVPRTRYLSDVTTMPADRERWLLKPLYSFAGAGIMFAPTDAEIAAIPQAERRNYILQERVPFTPVIATPHGATQAEIRIMLVREGVNYRAVMPLVRMGRGKMMGVDHNKNLEWVGASAALIDRSR